MCPREPIDTERVEFQRFIECVIEGASIQDVYTDDFPAGTAAAYAENRIPIFQDEAGMKRRQGIALKEFLRIFAHETNIASFVEECFGLKEKQVLDFGCGTGALSVALARKGARVVAADPTQISLEATEWRGRYFDLPEGQLSAVLIDSRLPLPFQPRSFDLVITNSVLEFIPHERNRYVQALLSLLKPGGILIIATENGFYPVDYYTGMPFMYFRRRMATRRNLPYGILYPELLGWVHEWSEKNGRSVQNLSTANYFNSVDKLIRRGGLEQSRPRLDSLFTQGNTLLKAVCRLLKIPSDLFFPYSTYIFRAD
jgi:2-polyprenyl-3-methyl-5-hydroxy-6-metoxy-1,4-benzoquinol methylase